MNFLEHLYFKTLKYDLLNKFLYKNTKKIPKIQKIILNFGCKNNELKNLATSLLALELVTKQKGALTTTKYSNLLLKIRKGNPVGCKLILRKEKIFKFLSKTLFEIFPKQKNFKGFNISKKTKKNIFSYELTNTFSFSELEDHYYLFNNLPKLNITIVIDSSKTKEELLFILKSIKFPINIKQI